MFLWCSCPMSCHKQGSLKKGLPVFLHALTLLRAQEQTEFFFMAPFTPAAPFLWDWGSGVWCRGREGALASITTACALPWLCYWAVIRWDCTLRIPKDQPRWIEFQSTWLVLFEMSGSCSAFVSFSASEMEPCIFQKCWAPLPRP